MFDLVLFFHPKDEILKVFGIDRYVYFGKNGEGIMFEDSSPSYIRRFFSKNYKKFILFGYRSSKRNILIKVLREGLIDFVVKPPLDYVILKFIKKEGIFIVYPLNEIERDIPKEIVYLKELYKVCKEKRIPLIVTSFSREISELKSRFLIERLLRYIGAKHKEIKEMLEENPKKIYELGLLRKNCSIPGVFYAEKEI